MTCAVPIVIPETSPFFQQFQARLRQCFTPYDQWLAAKLGITTNDVLTIFDSAIRTQLKVAQEALRNTSTGLLFNPRTRIPS